MHFRGLTVLSKESTVGIFFCKRTEEALADAQLPEPSISTMMKVMVFLFSLTLVCIILVAILCFCQERM